MNQLDDKVISMIEKNFPNIIFSKNVHWKEVTTLGIGSFIKLLAEPKNDIDLSSLLKYCYEEQIETFFLGTGSNMVGTDEPFNSIAIRLKSNDFAKIKFGLSHVTVGAGISLYELAVACAEKGFGGFAQLAGIPGTLGGSLRTNAGRLGIEISDKITEISGFDKKGEPWFAASKELEWKYRYSSLPEDIIVTAAILKVTTTEKSKELSIINESIASRNKTYPKERNAGCVFKNPATGHGAGKLIDLTGCKELTLGGAKVSKEHGNFFTNYNNMATEKDFLALALDIKSKVIAKTGIYLSPEIIFANNSSNEKLISTPKPLNILILKGGDSHERPVSLESAAGVSKALRDAGYNVKEYDIQQPVITDEMTKNIDVVFPVLHGGFGENGKIQAELERRNLRFVGSNSKASQIIIDKLKTKNIFVENGIPTAPFAVLNDGEKTFPSNLNLPVVVKAPNEGSTFGVAIVKDMSEWDNALKIASGDVSGMILVEQFINGYELTAGILDGKPLPLVHICPPCDFYDFDAKYTHQQGETHYITPPDPKIIPLEIQKQVQEFALKAYKATGAEHMARVDVLLSKDELKPYFLELNSIPGFTASSLLPKAAAAVDVPYIQLCGILVQLAAKRQFR